MQPHGDDLHEREPAGPGQNLHHVINGVDIDEYGAAPADEYFGDQLPFTEHMFMEPSLQSVEVGVCSCGQVGTAKVPLQYTGDFKDEAKTLAAKVASHDCECAAQLYGSTTTTANTVVSLLQKKTGKVVDRKCHCK